MKLVFKPPWSISEPMHFLPITLPLYTSMKSQGCLVQWREALGSKWKVSPPICRAIVVMGVDQFDAVPKCRIWNQRVETTVWLDRKNKFSNRQNCLTLPVSQWAPCHWDCVCTSWGTPVKVSEKDYFLPSPQCSDSERKLGNRLSGGSAFDVCAETGHVSLTQKGDGGELLGGRENLLLWPQGAIWEPSLMLLAGRDLSFLYPPVSCYPDMSLVGLIPLPPALGPFKNSSTSSVREAARCVCLEADRSVRSWETALTSLGLNFLMSVKRSVRIPYWGLKDSKSPK